MALWDEDGELNKGYGKAYNLLSEEVTEEDVVKTCINSGLVSIEDARMHPLWPPVLARLGLIPQK